MIQDKEIAQYGLDALLKAGADKAQCYFVRSEVDELYFEDGVISLLRTNFKNSLNLKTIIDGKVGTLSLNKTDKESIDKAVMEVTELAKSSSSDEAQDISPKLENKDFSYGPEKADREVMYKRLTEFLTAVKDKYPKVNMRQGGIEYEHSITHFVNSNGVYFTENEGRYSFGTMFAAKDGSKTSSFNYDGYGLKEVDQEILKIGDLEDLLKQIEEQLDAKSCGDKFVGDVIFTPKCLQSFVGPLLSHLKDGMMISGTSKLKEKIGEKVAHESLNISSKPTSETFASRSHITGDGFETKDCDVIKNGVLQTYLLSQYGANKTGLERGDNYGSHIDIASGDKSFDELVKSIKKGVLMCRFSGGRPAPGGEFSGIAKNSYYIEDGEIKYPLSETMVSGNVFDIFSNITGISKERVNYGSSVAPWLATSGMTISGK